MKRDVFQAIADPTRRDILSLLAAKSMTPNSIAEQFDSSRQAVSKHIHFLVECDLLDQEKQGRKIYYHINPEKMNEIEQWIQQFKGLLEKRFDQLDEVLTILKAQKK